MITPEAIRTAASTESLLSTIASDTTNNTDQMAATLAGVHNDGTLDILKVFRSTEVIASASPTFLDLLHVFCLTLPRIHCSVAEAAVTCNALFDKAGDDLAARRVYDALGTWLQLSRCRVDEGLALVRNDLNHQTGITRHVLVAGAEHDPKKYAEEALDLSCQPQPHIRQDALAALGDIAPKDDGAILRRITERLDQVIESPSSDHELATAIGAALHLLDRFGQGLVSVVELLLVKACTNAPPISRHAIARGLHSGHASYTDKMICTSFSAIQHIDQHDPEAVKIIDSILSEWDLNSDRKRVIHFLRNLLSNGDDAITIEALSRFQLRLKNGPGNLLGWYVISLLLTGNPRISRSVCELLPQQEPPDGLAISLDQFDLDPKWVLFLAQQIIGYCLMSKASASMLLLSCIRAASTEDRTDVENLVFDHFLLNFPDEIERLRAALSPSDPGASSVRRLSKALASYMQALQRTGSCAAFRPSAREGQIQAHRQAGLAREILKDAGERSVLLQLVPQSTLLYGSGTVYFVHSGSHREPQRQEVSLASYGTEIAIPRLEILDPVRLHYTICRCRSETPPK